MEILLAIVFGGLFGFALSYVGASNPNKLIAMLRLEYLTLMKMIVFAIGFASVLLALSNLIGIFNIDHFSVKATNLGVIIGGLIFGLGFGWAGTCPGTCIAATTGNEFKKAISAVVGGLLGAHLLSLTYGWWKGIGLFDIFNLGKVTLFKISDKYDYLISGSFWGLLIVGIIFIGGSLLMPKGNSNLE